MEAYLLILPSPCEILPCTSATPSRCQAWEPGHCELVPCLGWRPDQFTLVTQKATHLPKHLAWFQCTYLRPIWNSKSTWESEEVLQCLQFMIWKKSNHRLQIKQVRHVESILKNSFAPSYLIGWWKGRGWFAPSLTIIVRDPLLSDCSGGKGKRNDEMVGKQCLKINWCHQCGFISEPWCSTCVFSMQRWCNLPYFEPSLLEGYCFNFACSVLIVTKGLASR